MATIVNNKDLEAFQFQEGRPTQSAPITYRPTRPVLPITVSPAILPTNSIQAIKTNLALAATPSDADKFLLFRGTWQSFITYSTNDVVVQNLSTYVATQSSVGSRPDQNSTNWTIVGENLVFNPTQVTQVGVGFGAFSANKQNNTALGNSGAIGPITTFAPGQIGFLVSCQSSDNVPATWIKIFADGFSDGAYIKTFPSVATINDTLATSRAAQVVLFNGSWNQALSLPITSVAVTSNVVTCLCANNFIVGTQVTFSNLSSAIFLDGVTATITAANPTSFQVSFTHANYGPTPDSGTAINLPYLQTSGLLTGSAGNPSFTFPKAVKAGSVLVACATSNDTNYVANIVGISTNQGDSFAILNNNGFISGSAFSADIAYAQTAKGGATTITLTATGPSSALKVAFFEMPGGVTFLWEPFDVVEFRGSMFVCLKETAFDAFSDPTSWALIGPGTGFVNSQTGNYTAVAADAGHLLSFNSSSATTLTLPNPVPAPPAGAGETGWFILVENIGTGTLTISNNTLTIDGVAGNLTLGQNQGVMIFADSNGNYETFHGVNSLSMPGIFTVTAPNGSGQVTVGLATESANTVFAGPASGGAATPTFRLIVNADLPITVPTVPPEFTLTGNVASPAGSLVIGKAVEPANTFWKVGSIPAQPTFALIGPGDIPASALPPSAVTVVVLTQTTTSKSGIFLINGVRPPAGIYRVGANFWLQANPSAGTLDISIGWFDGTQARTATNGTNGMPADISTSALNVALGTSEFFSDGSHDITWSMTLT